MQHGELNCAVQMAKSACAEHDAMYTVTAKWAIQLQLADDPSTRPVFKVMHKPNVLHTVLAPLCMRTTTHYSNETQARHEEITRSRSIRKAPDSGRASLYQDVWKMF